MKNLLLILLMFTSSMTYAQVRAFDNSKAVMPWLYNPAAFITSDFQAYVGYDGRGKTNFTPQSVTAGLRMPVLKAGGSARQRGNRNIRNNHNRPASMVGVQLMSTSQDLTTSTTVTVNYAHQIPVNERLKFTMALGAGVHNFGFDQDALVYLDTQDELLNQGEGFFNLQLNAGISIAWDERLFLNIAAPNLLESDGANVQEVIVRAGYALSVNEDLKVIAAANLDTFNNDMVYGGDLRFEMQEIVSVIAGADRYKYYGGVMVHIKMFSLGYSYGRNYDGALNHIQSNQIMVTSNFPF